jgi:hypothetical protein
MAAGSVLVMGQRVKGLRIPNEPFWELTERVKAAVDASLWFESGSFRALCMLFVFDAGLPRVEVVVVDTDRDDELLVRCSPPVDEARAALRKGEFPKLLDTFAREALAAVGTRFGLPSLSLGDSKG